MSKLSIQELKISFKKPVPDFTEAELAEWLKVVLDLQTDLPENNPLRGVSLKDCNMKAGRILLDGKDITDTI